MKKIVLGGLLVLVSCMMKAQNIFYPSDSTVTPTWGYDGVVSEDDGNYLNPSTGKFGCVIDDAELDFVTFNRGDAYDGAFEFFINVQDSVYTESGLLTGGVDTVGTTISLGEQLIDGFFVSKKYCFSPTEPVVAAIFKIRNPTGTVRTTKVGIYSNLGSDSRTKLDTCFTGKDTLSDADRWMVTTDALPYDNGDPINTWVRFGPGAIASTPVFGMKPEKGKDDYLDSFAITVPANSYALIMQINRMDSDTIAARKNAARFNTFASIKSAGYLNGLSNEEMGKIVNWVPAVICNPISVDNPQSICSNESYKINGHIYRLAGNYNDTLKRALGCDSIIVTKLTVTNLDVGTTSTNSTITVNQTGATYQWVDCDNAMAAINGETMQSFTATKTGNYAVIVTKGNCSDTSICKMISITDVSSNQSSDFSVYPNPSSGLFTVNSNGAKTITVFNATGKVVYQANKNDDKSIIDITNQASGIYILQITNTNRTSRRIIMKQ